MSGDCRVLLIGMMGSGKSTIGRLLSERTGWPYLDNDELVRRTHGMTARRLQAEHGTEVMRAAESDALGLGLTIEPPAIIGVAAGVVLREADRRALEGGGIVVWLHADADTLATRASDAGHRPFLDADPKAWMRATVAEREPIYRSVADIVFDTGSDRPEATADRLHEWLETQSGCRTEAQP